MTKQTIKLKDRNIKELIAPMLHPEDGSFCKAPSEELCIELIDRASKLERIKNLFVQFLLMSDDSRNIYYLHDDVIRILKED